MSESEWGELLQQWGKLAGSVAALNQTVGQVVTQVGQVREELLTEVGEVKDLARKTNGRVTELERKHLVQEGYAKALAEQTALADRAREQRAWVRPAVLSSAVAVLCVVLGAVLQALVPGLL